MLPEPCDPAPEMQTTVIDVSVSYMQLNYLDSRLIAAVVTHCVQLTTVCRLCCGE